MRTYIRYGEPTLLHPLLLFFTNLHIPVSMLIARDTEDTASAEPGNAFAVIS